LVDVVTLDEIDASGTVTTVDGDLIEWSEDGYLRKVVGHWTERLRGIRATIQHGIPTDDCLDLAMLCANIVARASASPFGEKAQTVGSVSVQFSTTPGGQSGGVVLFDHQMIQLDHLRLFGRP
jgi:hypothetical protein